MSYVPAVDPVDDTKVNIFASCMICGSRSYIQVDRVKFLRWWGGEFIQDVWPELDDGQRELIKTGTHSECWDKEFKEEE